MKLDSFVFNKNEIDVPKSILLDISYYLDNINKLFIEKNKNIVVLSGEIGSGKTVIAREYANNSLNKETFNDIFYLKYDNINLGILLNKLVDKNNVLIVVDNIDFDKNTNLEQIFNLSSNNIYFILVTRDSVDIPPIFEDIIFINKKNSNKLVSEFLFQEEIIDKAVIEQIIKLTSGNLLILSQIRDLVVRYNFYYSDVIRQLNENKIGLFRHRGYKFTHPYSFYDEFLGVIDCLLGDFTYSIDLLFLLSLIDGGIEYEILKSIYKSIYNKNGDYILDNSIKELRKYSLLNNRSGNKKGKIIYLNPIYSCIIKDKYNKLSDPFSTYILSYLNSIFNDSNSYYLDYENYIFICNKLFNFIDNITDSQDNIFYHDEIVLLLEKVSFYLLIKNKEYERSIKFLYKILVKLEDCNNCNNLLAYIYSNIGYLYSEMKDYWNSSKFFLSLRDFKESLSDEVRLYITFVLSKYLLSNNDYIGSYDVIKDVFDNKSLVKLDLKSNTFKINLYEAFFHKAFVLIKLGSDLNIKNGIFILNKILDDLNFLLVDKNNPLMVNVIALLCETLKKNKFYEKYNNLCKENKFDKSKYKKIPWIIEKILGKKYDIK